MSTAKQIPSQGSSLTGFSRIRLLLAREPGHPSGSDEIGYDLIVPLLPDGRIDARRWKEERDLFSFRHFRQGEEVETGHMIHKSGGSWAFRADILGDDDEAAAYRFQDERFTVGEYVSIREDDGLHTYRVASVQRL